VVAVVAIFPSISLTQTGAPGPEKKAGEAFKNLQVLKDIPANQLIPAMQFITSSLGVQCEFCHVENAFDKDDKKTKQIARKMMQMQFAIDANNFDGKQMVTCNSCHRGSPKPVAIPVITEAQPHLLSEAVEPEQSGSPSLPKLEEIIAKYVTALGGAAAISKLTTLHETGTFEAGGRQFPVEIFVQSPDHIATVTHWPNGDSSTVFNGQAGWSIFPGRPLRPMTPADMDSSRMDADLHFALDLGKTFPELKTGKDAQIGGQDRTLVSAQRQELPPVELYFDGQSGLLVRMVRYAQSALGRNPTQIDYSDYRDVSGVKLPFHWTSATPTGRFTIQLQSAEANVPIPAKVFERPASEKAKTGP
jgi:hypothetical protein